jgi:hypothetical protein
MRITASLRIWDEEPYMYERVWFGIKIELLWWKAFFRISRSLTQGHLGSEGMPYIRFFLGSTTKHVRLITTSRTVIEGDIARQELISKWCWRLR